MRLTTEDRNSRSYKEIFFLQRLTANYKLLIPQRSLRPCLAIMQCRQVREIPRAQRSTEIFSQPPAANFKLQTILLLSVILLLTSFTTFKEPQYTGVKDFKVEKLDASGLNALVVLGIKNPNSVGFSVYRSKFDVYYDGIYLGKTRSRRRVHIKPNSDGEYPFRLKGKFTNVGLPEIMRLIGNAGKANLQIKGNVKAGKFFIRKKFPVDVKERVGL